MNQTQIKHNDVVNDVVMSHNTMVTTRQVPNVTISIDTPQKQKLAEAFLHFANLRTIPNMFALV